MENSSRSSRKFFRIGNGGVGDCERVGLVRGRQKSSRLRKGKKVFRKGMDSEKAVDLYAAICVYSGVLFL